MTNKNIVSLETGWKNNIRMDAGFFPGSGFQTAGDGSTGAIRGRLEFGNRVGNLKFVARFENGSTEYTKLKAQTTGTAVVTLAYDVSNSLQLTWQKVAYSVVEIAETGPDPHGRGRVPADVRRRAGRPHGGRQVRSRWDLPIAGPWAATFRKPHFKTVWGTIEFKCDASNQPVGRWRRWSLRDVSARLLSFPDLHGPISG